MRSGSPEARRESRLILAIGKAALGPALAVARARPGAVVCLPELIASRELLRQNLAGTLLVVLDSTTATVEELLAVASVAAESSPNLSLSLVYGRGPEQLFAVARRFAPVAPVAPREAPQHLLSAMDQPISLRAAQLRLRNAVFNTPQEVADRLLEPAELLFLVGHANAMHLSVGGAVLCRRSTARVEPDQRNVYPCFHGDPCFFSQNRDEVEVAVDRLRARRVLLLSCFGVSPVGATFHPSFGIGEGLLHHARIEVLITPLRAATLCEADLAILYFLCNAGLPMGAVANRFNRYRLASGNPAEMLCFGDAESRLEATLTTVACHRDGERWILEPPAPNGIAQDLVAALPAGSVLPSEPILIDETAGSLLSAVIDPTGALYASLPADWKGQPLRFRLMERGDLAEAYGAGRQLLGDLAFLDLYLPLVARRNGESAALKDATEAHAALRDLLQSWPLADLAIGMRIEERQLEALWRELRRRVDSLATRFAELYVDLMTRDQRTHPTPWDSLYQTVLTEKGKLPCDYCGHEIDEFETQARLGWARRSWALCRANCAYIYDGHPGLGRWLGLPAELTAGQPCNVTLATRNPYRIPVAVRAVGVLKHFEPGKNQPGPPAAFDLAPSEERSITFKVEVPSSFRQGVYHLGACLVVGAQCNFYRAQVQVARA